MNSPAPTVSVSATVLRRTSAALLVRDADGTEGWVPRSQVVIGEEGTIAGAQAVLEMPCWLASDRGFVGQVGS